MIRYIWIPKDGKYIYRTSEFKREDKIEVPHSPDSPIFVNILERRAYGGNTAYKVKLFYSNGEVLEGWITDMLFPVKVTNQEELFDGRFNQ